MGDLSKNFSRYEFKCGHCGRLDVLDDDLVKACQRLRDIVGKPLAIVSAYRCCVGNASVGGVQYSEHLFGRAIDLRGGYATVAQAKRAGFIGIGVRRGKVVHLDLTPGRRPFTFND